MGSGVAEVATIFHPRRSRAPSIILSEDQANHGPYASPGQVILDASGQLNRQGTKLIKSCLIIQINI